MRKEKFAKWLEDRGYEFGTIRSRISNCQRICEYEGSIDQHYEKDQCKSLLARLEYSTADERKGLSARHNIPINGVKRTGTATYKQALGLYISFIQDEKNSSKISNKAVSVMENQPIIDSYALFFEHFEIDKNKFYKFGIEKTIFSDIMTSTEQWNQLKNNLLTNQQLSIRGYGRQGSNTHLFLELYGYLFDNNNIIQDPTNNNAPRRNIQIATGFMLNNNIFNYQCSHIFGKTKNPLMFEAVWNICLTPKIIDPLTGHETTGDWPKEFQIQFKEHALNLFKDFIYDYNNFIRQNKIEEGINDYITSVTGKYNEGFLEKFKKDALSEWAVIKGFD